jgi:alkylation response protein AidB-like acyl-CoA dehydrogenase
MTATVLSPVSSIEAMHGAVEELAADVRLRSAEFEELRDLPQDVFEAIARTSVTRIAVPRGLGGLEGTPRDWFAATTRLAEADPSVAWIVAQGVVQNAWLSIFAGTEFARQALADPRALPATSIAGKAVLRPAGNGRFTLKGAWQFLSGSSGATLIGGLAFVPKEDGPPEARFVVVPAEQASITPSWDNVGLRGTGSHEASVGPLEVDEAQTWVFQTGEARFAHPFECFGRGTWPISVSVSAVQIGIARRALDEFANVARNKAQLAVQAGTDAPLSANPAIQRAYARAEATMISAREGVLAALEALWAEALQGPIRPETARRCQLAAASAAWLCADVIRTAYTLAGTTAQRDGHALQRCFRDGNVLTAHISVNEGTLEAIGRQLLA